MAGADVTVTVTCVTNQYTISANVTGLSGSGLVLQDNATNNLPIAGTGTTPFTVKIASGSPYAVTVLTQPTNPSQTCTPTSGSGTVIAAPVVVAVNCTTNTYNVGGTVIGLTGTGLVLQDNAGDNKTINASGAFTFATKVASNAAYAVTVLTPPSTPAQKCAVNGTSGSGTVTSMDVTTVIIDCSGMFVFAANPADGTAGSVAAFTIDPVTGALTGVAGSPYDVSTTVAVDIAPYGLALDPSGSYLYVTNSNSASVSTYGINADGTLHVDLIGPVSTAIAPATATNQPLSLAIDPAGPYLYVGTNDNPNGLIEGFLSTAGTLTALTGSPYTSVIATSLNVPYGLAIDSTHSFLYAANIFAPDVDSYSITGGTGVLAELSASPDGTLTGPYTLATYPGGNFVYITDTTAAPGTVKLVTIDATGVVTVVHSYTVGTKPQGIAIDPAGKFLYVSNTGDGRISAFKINASTGVLTTIAGSPFTASGAASSNTPTPLAIDSSGRFLYASNGDDGTISEFTIDSTTGVLTAVAGSPVNCTIDAPHSGLGASGIAVQ